MRSSWSRLVALAVLALPTGAVALAAQATDTGTTTQIGVPEGTIPTTKAWRDLKMFRVCGDPDNMPFSNSKQQGFENRIASLIATALGDSLVYLWWPHRRGFVRSTLRSAECDVIMGVPTGFDPALETKPYYSSTYYVVSRADRHIDVRSLDDPAIKKLKIGVNIIGYDYTNTPPAEALAARGISNLKGYSTFYGEEHQPRDIIDGVVNGEVDIALVWGPLAGYFAKHSPVPLKLVALPDSDSTGLPFAYDMAIGVRHADRELKTKLDSILEAKRDEIQAILREYNVPTVSSTQ
ncbi:MAG TPA: substrate-binding domain-containing protein [Gemmatimonadaceae bacterium]